MSVLYFAYGSNMLPARLGARCPSARVVGTALARGRDIAFSKVGMDGSGKATLLRSAAVDTPGVLFEIADLDVRALDRAEGAGVGYDRVDDFAVELPGTGARIAAATYLARDIDPSLLPFDWYLAVVVAGAKHHGLDHVDRLRRTRHRVDDDLGRGGRAEVLRALGEHGIADYRALL